MMEIIQFFFSGPHWFFRFVCLLALIYALSPTIEKHYYFDGEEYTGDSETGSNSRRNREASTSQDDSKVSKE